MALLYPAPMKDRLVFGLFALAAVAIVGFAAIWPQGYGDRSPGPFGHIPIQQTAEMKAALAREAAAQERKRHGIASAAAAAGLRTTPVPTAAAPGTAP